jgi:ELWxxDGT repeat protein
MTRLASALPGTCHQFGTKLVFTDGRSPNLRGVWVSDGSVAGTVPLIRYARPVFAPFCIVNLRKRLLFSTTHAGGELFESDGTAAGTKVIRRTLIRGMVAVEDRLFALEEIRGSMCLTVGDGSSANTVVLSSALPPSVVGIWAAGSKVFFHGFVAGTAELWVSDGSSAGTQRVKSFATRGTELPRLEGMSPIGSRKVFFRVVHSQSFGVELWQSDGTVLGTHPIADIYRGPGSGVDDQLTHAQGKLFFRGDDGMSGSLDGDLWSYELGAVAYEMGSGCAASGFPPRLTGTDPVVGGTMRLQVDGRPSSVGVLLLGTPAAPVTEIGFGCRLFLDLGVGFALGFQTSTTGRWQMTNVRVPNIPGTSGLRLVMQVALGGSTQLPFGLDFSSGLVLIAGN